MKRKVEVLAPAGSYDIMKAAFRAGADAVYIGGSMFGARAFADNPGQDALMDAIDYAHLHGKRLYLTVNTLLKNEELESELYRYLKPYYERGLDAVIVQDPGVFDFVKRHFPGMEIHASTQMTVCGVDYGRYLADQGASRIVTPRELTFEEIRAMKEATGLEIETFVHGALCYCYSGQCLMSSMIGGRSGNRGRCAQPCRLPYTFERDGKKTSGHLLSPKDLCSLDLLPDLIDAGVDSLKIEGRMKKAEYAAFTASVYRKYLDMYFEKGREGYKVDPADKEALMDLYNRGGFTDGYFRQHNGRHMMTIERPNHSGLAVGRAVPAKKGQISIKLTKALGPGDVLEMPDASSLKIDQAQISGKVISRPYKGAVPKNYTVMRTRNESLIRKITADYVTAPDRKEAVTGRAVIAADQPMTLCVTGFGYTVTTVGEIPQAAIKQPMTEEDIRKRISKTGDTPFAFSELKVELTGNVFIPVNQLNQLRREALDELKTQILNGFRREVSNLQISDPIADRLAVTHMGKKDPDLHVMVSNIDQLRTVLDFSKVNRIYAEYLGDDSLIRQMAQMTKAAGKDFYLAGPMILREESRELWLQGVKLSEQGLIDGFLSRNMETSLLLKKMGNSLPIIADHQMYCMNDRASAIYGSLHDEITVPLELNRKEIFSMEDGTAREMVLYGYTPVMVSAQCLSKTCGMCKHVPGIYTMTDRLGKKLKIRHVCPYCYNVIYNTVPLYIPEIPADNEKTRTLRSVRLQFLDENSKVIGQVMQAVEDLLKGGKGNLNLSELTRGHYKRGVE